MKKLLLLCLANAASITLCTSSRKLPEVPTHRYMNIVTPSFQNPIHSSDLSESANPQYSIKSSGRYYLVTDLTQEHNTAGGVVLLVNASNVSLDMNTKSIVPHISGSLSTGTGIAVAQGKNNIQIMNGSIHGEDTSGNQKLNKGIDLSETTLSGGSGTSYTIKIQGLFITRCKGSGISGTSINDVSVESSTVNDGSGSSEVDGAIFTTCKNVIVKNCEFSNNASSASDCYGLRLIDCTNGFVENVNANKNSAVTTVAGLLCDYDSVGSSNIKFKNVNSSSNNSSAGLAMGFSVIDSFLISVDGGIFNGNTSSSVDGAAGVSVRVNLANCDNLKLVNVECSQNSCSAHTAYGIVAEGNNHYFENVTANNNSSSANQTVAGIFLSSSNNSTLLNCNTNRNRNTNTSSSSSASGYGIAVVGNNNSVKGCIARSNSTSANSTVRAVGIYASTGSNNRVEDCTTTKNNASHTTAAVTSAGIMFNSTEKRSQIINCKTSENFVGDGTSSGSSARSYGIYFGATSGADQCLVKNCSIVNNYANGSGLAFGFYDNDTSSTSLLMGNVAIGQGQCLGDILDASMQWNNNSEPSTGQNYFFKHAGTGDDPRDMIHEVPRENFVSLSSSVMKWQNVSVYDAS